MIDEVFDINNDNCGGNTCKETEVCRLVPAKNLERPAHCDCDADDRSPVCAIGDGGSSTYFNACFATCLGAAVVYEGVCERPTCVALEECGGKYCDANAVCTNDDKCVLFRLFSFLLF